MTEANTACGCLALPRHGEHGRNLCPFCGHLWDAHDKDVFCTSSDAPITNPQDPAAELDTPGIPREWWLRAKAFELLALSVPELDSSADNSPAEAMRLLEMITGWIEHGRNPFDE